MGWLAQDGLDYGPFIVRIRVCLGFQAVRKGGRNVLLLLSETIEVENVLELNE